MRAADLGIAVLLLLGGGAAAKAASAKREEDGAEIDAARLVSRANQERALSWAIIFANAGAPPKLAAALARWAGIESSGNPLAVSRLGERGLFQISEQEALKEKPPALNYGEWAAMVDRATVNEQHARIAMNIADWEWARAKRHVKGFPTPDYISSIWYAKLYHQRPVDVRDAKMHGPALPMARELAKKWAADPAKMHRLRAANVVAFGTATP